MRRRSPPRPPQPAPPPAPPTFSEAASTMGEFAGGVGIGATLGGTGAQWAQATATGRIYNPAYHLGGILGPIGGAVGFLAGGPGGAALGAGIFGGIGNLLTGQITGMQNALVQRYLTGTLTGMSESQMLGIVNPLASMLNPLSPTSSMADPSSTLLFNQVGPAAAYTAVSAIAPAMVQGYGFRTGVMGAAARMIQAFGSPIQDDGGMNPAFLAAANALNPMFADPFLSGAYRQSIAQRQPLSRSTMLATYAMMGPAATSGALSALAGITGDRSNLAGFADLNYQLQSGDLWIGMAGQSAAITGARTGIAALSGSRSGLLSALGAEAAAYGDVATFNRRQFDLLSSGVPASGPWTRDQLALASRAGPYRVAAEGAEYQQRIRQYGMATAPADASWGVRMMELDTTAAIQSMDPFMPMVSAATRQERISGRPARIAQILQQTANNPAAQLAMMPELSNLRIGQAADVNALRFGVVGQYMNLFAGMPTGTQGLGLSALALGNLQAQGGFPTAFGGAGGGAGSSRVERLLESILLAIRGQGASSGAAPSITEFISDRSKR